VPTKTPDVLKSCADPTPTNLAYDSTGKFVNASGFGTVASRRPAREVQILVRFQF